MHGVLKLVCCWCCSCDTSSDFPVLRSRFNPWSPAFFLFFFFDTSSDTKNMGNSQLCEWVMLDTFQACLSISISITDIKKH